MPSRNSGVGAYHRYIFQTVDLLSGRGKLQERDFARLAISLARMREKQGLVLTAKLRLAGVRGNRGNRDCLGRTLECPGR